MPSSPRHAILPPGEDCVVHTFSRCVRRAFLCGRDAITGKNYEHRREWIREQIEFLAASFAIEVCAHAVMSNHCHLVLWARPSLAASWSAEEVARRWLCIYNRSPKAAAIAQLAADEEMIAKLRARLGSVSWFMSRLNEFIARMANKEDDCTGRFWEGRFKSQLLADDGAVLACMAYVDLNPVRAKIAATLETSAFTSVQARLFGRNARRELTELGAVAEPTPEQREMLGLDREKAKADAWLCPMGSEAGRHTVLDMSLDGYLALVEWTGSQLRTDDRGTLGGEMEALVVKRGLDAASWVASVLNFGRMFHHAVGTREKLRERARARGCRRAWGTTSARAMYAV